MPDLLLEVDAATHFSEALLPRRILRVEKIPRTRTGKLLRPQLTEQLQQVNHDQQSALAEQLAEREKIWHQHHRTGGQRHRDDFRRQNAY